ncbi:hypothetical protein ACWIXK_10830, partial [Ursidibacter sp. B-7004-1]
MKKSLLALLVLGSTLTLAACDQAKEKATEVKQATEAKVEEAKTAVVEAKDAVADKATEMKDVAAAKVEE